jgi:hypothetical protein
LPADSAALECAIELRVEEHAVDDVGGRRHAVDDRLRDAT